MVELVRILSRVDQGGEELAGALITINGKECGKVQDDTKTRQWYEVKCKFPLVGKEV